MGWNGFGPFFEPVYGWWHASKPTGKVWGEGLKLCVICSYRTLMVYAKFWPHPFKYILVEICFSVVMRCMYYMMKKSRASLERSWDFKYRKVTYFESLYSNRLYIEDGKVHFLKSCACFHSCHACLRHMIITKFNV